MRLALLIAPLACLLFSFAPAWAGDPEPSASKDALSDAASQCPVTLADIVSWTRGTGRRPLRAEFLLDTARRLMARALVREDADEKRTFEEWIGPVHAAGWVPRRRELAQAEEITEASRLQALLDPVPEALRQALVAAVRTEENADRPADVALSVVPISRDGESAVALRVRADGEVRGLAFDPKASTFKSREPAAAPEPVAYEARRLPPLDVPGGRWFNVEGEPSLEAWRGHPVLVLVTDPG